jgi:hypothetical protein
MSWSKLTASGAEKEWSALPGAIRLAKKVATSVRLFTASTSLSRRPCFFASRCEEERTGNG